MESKRLAHGDGSGNRRREARLRGPFEGLVLGPLDELPIQIFDLSEDSCVVSSVAPPTARLTLKVHLPEEGWIVIGAALVREKPDHGSIVRFTEIAADDRARLERSLRRLRLEQRWLTANTR